MQDGKSLTLRFASVHNRIGQLTHPPPVRAKLPAICPRALECRFDGSSTVMTRRFVCTACALTALTFLPGAAAVTGLDLRAADRTWQTGKWTAVKVTRPRVAIGLSGRPFGSAPQDARATEFRTYVIETDELR